MTVLWRRAGDVLARPTSEGTVVLLADGRAAGTLAGLEHELWALLAEPATVSQLCDRATHRARPAPGPTEAAVTTSLAGLAARGLVLSDGAPEGPLDGLFAAEGSS